MAGAAPGAQGRAAGRAAAGAQGWRREEGEETLADTMFGE
jgi:hypothetical protein